jgi:Phage portal protein.
MILEFATENFLRGDTISRYQAYAIGIQNGFLAPNEIRVLENRNPMEGGDDIMLPLNMTQAGSKVSGDDVAGNEGRTLPGFMRAVMRE